MLDDLAYARSLAEEGRHAPLIGGSYLVLFGVLLTVCYGLQWAVLSGVLAAPTSFIGLGWIVFSVVAFAGSLLLGRRVRKLPGGAAIPNRVDRAVWHGVIAALFAVVAGTIVRGVMQADYTAPNAIVASGFGLYGVALYVTSTVGGHAWVRSFALMSWVTSGVLWFFVTNPVLYLLAAGASVIVLIAPGVIMMRREPATTV